MADYNVVGRWDHLDPDSKAGLINSASDEELEQWASDPDCNQKLLAATALAKRNYGKIDPARTHRRPEFNARTEVSADARQIVKHLWIIFVALPFILAVLYEILKN